MHTTTIIITILTFLCLQCSAQSFSFPAYLQTNGDDQIHTHQITGTIDHRTITLQTPDTTWSHRIITRVDYVAQVELILSCGGKMTIYKDFNGDTTSFFYTCPSLGLYSGQSFVQALKDGLYQK